jgi:TonB family protein
MRVWTAIGAHLWQTTLVLALFLLLGRALRDAPARFLLALHWTAFAKLFVPLSLAGGVTAWLVHELAEGSEPAESAASAGLFVVSVVLNPLSGFEAGGTRPVLDALLLVLSLAWGAGSVAFLARFALGAIRCAREPLLALDGLDAPLRAKLESALERTAIPRERLALTSSLVAPGVRGMVRPRIVIPLHSIEDLDVEELRAVLLHEEGHRLRRDPLLEAARAVALSLYFFHPLVWLLAKRLREAAELACDERAVRSGARPEAYLRAFSKTVDMGLFGTPLSPALHAAGRSSLRERVRRITEPWRYVAMRKHRIAIALAILVAAVASIAPVRSVGAGATAASLEGLAARNVPITLRFEAIPLERIFDALTRAAEFQVEFVTSPSEGDLSIPATIEAEKTPLSEVLATLGARYGLDYQVVDASTLRVRGSKQIGSGVTPPTLEKIVDPVYPEALRAAGKSDKVYLTAIVRADGTVGEVSVLQHASEVAFDESAIAALRQWRYRPATKDGEPVEVLLNLVIEFRADGYGTVRATFDSSARPGAL